MNTPKKKILLTAFFVFSVVFAAGAFAEDIVIDQNTTWAAGTYDYNSVQVTNGATLTFNGAVILNAQNLTIDSGSFISANGTGYPAGTGAGAGGLNGVHGAGGGYGGKGGPLAGAGGATYGSAIAPVDLGSGGGYTTGGKGGGAIRLNINNLVVNGKISANGADGTTDASNKKGGGGSGGSIYITAGQLSGSGLIIANGGYGMYGSGGGGRIAIHYSTSTFQGTIESKKGTSTLAAYYGQNGTICFVDALNNVLYPGPIFRFEASDSPFDFNEIVLDNNSTVTTNGNISLSADNLTIGNSSSLILSGDATVATAGNLNITGGSDLTLSGNCRLVVTGTFNLENSSITTAGPQSLVLPSFPNITVTGQSTLIWGPGLYSYDNVSITGNSSLVFNGAVTLEAPSVTIDPGSSISAKGTGYPAQGGPGTGGLNGVHGAGGGYGGKGGPLAGAGGATYGSAIAPVDLGSGGGYTTGGKGGGAIRLNVGNLAVNGNISADGADGTADASGKKGGGGSGGSIYITAEQFSGSGSISANGGYGMYGSGGGGRIAIHYSTSTFQGTIESKKGTSTLAAYYGQDGTICLVDTLNNVFHSGHSFRLEESDSPFNFSEVVLDNNSIVSTKGNISLSADNLTIGNSSSLILSGDATVATVSNLNITGGSDLTLSGDCRLIVTGAFNLENSSITTAGPQSLVLPSPDITITAESTFIWGPGIYAYEDILITGNSSLIFNGAVTLNATNVTIDPCSSISANGTGYPTQSGPGAGGLTGVHGTGGGYGGKGGPLAGAGGATYGSPIAPVDLGSGGGYTTGGKGGGAIRLNVGNLVANGNITANGTNGVTDLSGKKGGGGSGGSVYITAEQFSGSGLISANGGYGMFGGGGGGRIAIYYSTSTFQGTVESKKGTGLTAADYGENGSVIFEEPSIDSPITAMQSSATSPSESTLSETLRVLTANLTNVEVTGDFNGVMNFSDFKVITIESGSFTGQGFAKAAWQVNIDGVGYAGVWHAMVTRVQTETENTIYMKGVISGEISGITEGNFIESANDPNIIGAYSSKWMLNRMKGQVVVAPTIELSGVLSSQQTTDYPATGLYVLQASFDANSYGHYTGPLGVILTHVRVKDQSNVYYGEGFSMLSYVSDAGQGLASSYNTLEAPGVALLKGSSNNPLLGILNATLDESTTVKRLSITIERIDFNLPAEPVLSVRIWAPSRVSPGETVNYTIEYRNDGTGAAKNVRILHKLPENVEVLSYTGNAYYRANGIYDDAPDVVWVIDNVPAKSKGYLATTVRVKWGLSESDTLTTYAMAESYEMHFDPNITVDSTVVEANSSFVNVNHVFAVDNNAMWTLNTTCSVRESTIEMNEPNLVVTATDTNFIASLEFTANPRFYVKLVGGKGGGVLDLTTLVEVYIMKDDRRFLTAVKAGVEERNYIRWLYYNDFIDQPTFEEYSHVTNESIIVTWSAQDIVGRFEEAGDYYDFITKGVMDKLINLPLNNLGEVIIAYESQKPEPRIRMDSPENAIQDTLELHMKNYRITNLPSDSPWTSETIMQNAEEQIRLPWYDEVYLTIKRAITKLINWIRAAFDPNKLYGPDGRVLPGQKLDYKVEFENIGEGIAFGVYFTDTLDEDVNDATLQIGPVIDVNDGSILAGPGTYNPGTRTITWFVGQVDPNQGGYAEFSVDVNSEAQHGTEIINYATIYFPSVPQELRTNSIVSTVLLNLPPKADAGPDQSVHVGDVVVLDGSGSTDPDGDILTFKWAFGLKPAGSQAALNDANSLNPTFTPDVPGAYTVTLRVSDGQEQSQFDAIRISTTNVAPVADAGDDQTVHIGELVTLDASGSTDSDGDLLSYRWVFESVPAGSATVLNEPNSLNPSFVADVPGTYVVSLVVNDGMVDSEPDTVMISTVNLAPIAKAGEDQAVHIGDLVTLDGSGSTDADGNPLTYRWAFTVVPEGSDANLDDPNSVNPTFTADEPGTYVVSLIVNDGTEDSEPDTVTISTINVAPIADAGEDQAVYVGDLVMLNGSGSWDADGDPLSYSWSFTTIPDDSTTVLNGASTAEPNFVVDVPGTYVISLVVNDGTVNSGPDTVSVSTINVAPTADAGEDQSALVGHLVSLDGSDSNDPDGDSLSYLWAFTSVPNRSAAALDDPTSANPHFTPDVPGTYVVSLVVNDGTVNSEADYVTISAATQQTQAIAMVREVIDVVNGLDKSVFKNRYLKRALTRKLNVVIHSLERRRYCIALMVLKHDILGKIDGCALKGHADRNDWIIDCDAQGAVYPLVVELIDFLQ